MSDSMWTCETCRAERPEPCTCPASDPRNPHPHENVGRYEITRWPDDVIGFAIPGTVVNTLMTSDEARLIAAALLKLVP